MAMVKKTESALAKYQERIAAIDDEEAGIAHGVVLPRLHVAAGGALLLQDDVGETYKNIEGVVAVSRICRAYWPEAYGGEAAAAPDCTSTDGAVGVGDPGGHCYDCSLNEWPMGGGRKPCQEMRRLVVLAESGAYLLTLKPGSMRGWDRYAGQLRATGLRYYAVKTRFAVELAQNRAGIKFGRVVPTVVAPLDEAALGDVLAQYGSWASLLTQQRVAADEVADEDAEGVEGVEI